MSDWVQIMQKTMSVCSVAVTDIAVSTDTEKRTVQNLNAQLIAFALLCDYIR